MKVNATFFACVIAAIWSFHLLTGCAADKPVGGFVLRAVHVSPWYGYERTQGILADDSVDSSRTTGGTCADVTSFDKHYPNRYVACDLTSFGASTRSRVESRSNHSGGLRFTLILGRPAADPKPVVVYIEREAGE